MSVTHINLVSVNTQSYDVYALRYRMQSWSAFVSFSGLKIKESKRGKMIK